MAETILDMDGHVLAAQSVATARSTLLTAGTALTHALSGRLASAGWVIASFPPELPDTLLRQAAAGVLSGVGQPFYSIDGGRGLWLDSLAALDRDPHSFGGVGAQAVHIDAPNVTEPPDYTSLLMLCPDPAGGGKSVIADLRAAADQLDEHDRELLTRPVFAEGRAERLHGIGEPLPTFPILDERPSKHTWIRWAGKLLTDDRNTAYLPVLTRFASLLEATARQVLLRRGDLLIADQRRVAHGRTALGRQDQLVPAARRLLCQAKVRFDANAPIHELLRWAA
ncbi:TauD/TfdA family dioxygenase [Amycolatopsis keratiniphila]|uniref:TauD/TfdA family dioxygenase n=2 Tax=Amycolatopsis keratiniphila TaxID=129921 RepID=UPI001E577AB8|nr:TauD/TfdA family dioxygenase [Amycolatopsis keratiniphila]